MGSSRNRVSRAAPEPEPEEVETALVEPPLEGDETGELPEVSDEAEGAEPGTTPSPLPGDSAVLAVDEAAAKVAEAKAALAKAEADHANAVAQEEATKVVEKRDPLKVIGLDHSGSGTYSYVDAPEGFFKDRTIRVGRDNFEHVADDKDGVWLYRRM